MSDWNAADADLKVKKPSLFDRLTFTSAKGLTRRALKDTGAVAVSSADEPRFANIATGLAEALKLGPVDLFVVEGDGANALAGRIDRPVIGLTRSLLDTYARTELEAVVAHCLVRHRQSGRRGVVVGFSDDVRAVSLTRYPPALAAAIEKAQPHKGRHAGMYLVAEGPTHRPVEERVAALADL